MRRFISCCFIFLLLLFVGCGKEFLTNLPQGGLSEDVIQNEKGIDNLLIGAYSGLNQGISGQIFGSSPDNWVWGSILGGDAHKGSEGGDQIDLNPVVNFSASSSNNYYKYPWESDFDGITRANNVLKTLKSIEEGVISEDKTKRIEAEAKFIRGFLYFDLKKKYDLIPWIDESTENPNQPNDEDIWPKIEEDFKFGMQNLPEEQSQIGRVNKWAAQAYYAKVLLFQHKYQEARPLFEDLIENGNTSSGMKYDLNEEFNDNWKPELEETNPEAVFSIQETGDDGSGGITQSRYGSILNYPYPNSPWCCGFYQPSQDLVDSYVTDANGLPLIDNYNDNPLKSDMGIGSSESFSPDKHTNVDPRLDWTVGRRGVPFLDWGLHPGRDWIRDQTYGGPYSAKKYLYWQKTSNSFYNGNDFGPGSAVNYTRMRFSQVLLMAAECEIQDGENYQKAQEFVNRVRERAANPNGWLYEYLNPSNPMGGFSQEPAANYFVETYPVGYFSSIGKMESLKRIYFEEKLELALEGHRFFDLVRWGIAEEEINKYLEFEGQITSDIRGAHFTEKYKVLPIPLEQIDLSSINGEPVLSQNPGF